MAFFSIKNFIEHFSLTYLLKKKKIVKLTLGRTRGLMVATPPPPLDVFLSFFLEDKTSAPDVFSSCSFVPRAHFERSSVMVSFYGYEI